MQYFRIVTLIKDVCVLLGLRFHGFIGRIEISFSVSYAFLSFPLVGYTFMLLRIVG